MPESVAPQEEASTKPVRVFPAHLAPIDRFLLDDDTLKHPMTYVIQMDCQGVIEREVFEQALEGAIQRHPYTRAKIGPGKRGMLNWLDARGERPQVDWGDFDAPYNVKLPEGEAIDIRNHVGLRVWMRQDEQKSRVLFQWHHSVTDGTGAFRFIGDVLALYDKALGGEKSELLPLNPALLRERRTRMAPAYERGEHAKVRGAIWRFFKEVFAYSAATIAVPKKVGEATFPGYFSHTLSREQVNGLRDYAESHNATLNDLLLERLFQAVRDWNRRHAKPLRRKMRIMMPSDLRDSRETEMPVANMVGYTFVSRHAKECDDPVALLKSIAAETTQIKHAQTGKDFIDALTGAESVPWALPLVLHRGWCLSTTLLTNNGDPARRMNARLPRKGGKLAAGGLIVERFSGVPPIRDKSYLAIAAMTYARQLTINARFDPNHYGDQQSEEMLETYIGRLKEVIGQTA